MFSYVICGSLLGNVSEPQPKEGRAQEESVLGGDCRRHAWGTKPVHTIVLEHHNLWKIAIDDVFSVADRAANAHQSNL